MNSSYRFIRSFDPDYPQKLKVYPDHPTGLYLKGSLPDPAKKSVAIVGARSCSPYGRQNAVCFAKVLAEHGVQIISGLALGIDACAHKGALEGGGKTFAVLGCGIEQCYPRSNYGLYRQLLSAGGGVLTEFEPGSPAVAWHFPLRNRIISALSDAVLIIEARVKSGSLITASYALEQGIQVYALPGKVTDALSAGTNALIWQGAVPALSPETILSDLGIVPQKKEEHPSMDLSSLPAPERRLAALLSSDPVSFDTLCAKSGLSVQQASELLLRLELNGYVLQPVPGLYTAAYR